MMINCITRPVRILTAALLSTAAAADDRWAIRAAAYVDSSGELRKGALIIIDGGSISSVAVDGESAGDLRIVTYEGAVVSPGLIDVHAALGADGQLSERQSAVQPQANARDAFDRYHREFGRAARAGVTCLGLSPDDSNLVGGRIAICKTSGADGGPYVLSDSGPMKLSLSPAVFRRDREPTSRGGAVAMLRKSIEPAWGARTVFVATPSGADVLTMLRMARDYELKLVLMHQVDVRGVGVEIATAKAGVIVGPLGWSTSPRVATAAGLLEKKDVAVAIAGGLPAAAADSLRLGAALAARNGLSLAAARRAITSVPAEFLGVADRVGAIEKGRDADLVIFSGDPLDLRSRVLAVYIDGRLVHSVVDSRE